MHSGVTTGQNHKTDSRRNRSQETPLNIPPITNEVLADGTDTSYTESDSDMRNMSEEGPIRLEQTQISEKGDLLNKVLTTHANVISRFFWKDSSGIKRIQIHSNGAGFIHKVYLAHTNERHRCKDCGGGLKQNDLFIIWFTKRPQKRQCHKFFFKSTERSI